MRSPRMLLYVEGAVLCGLVIGTTLFTVETLFPPNRNRLAIGGQASVQEVAIDFRQPVELDGLSQAEVLRLRSEAVMGHADLLAAPYRPSEAVFGQIDDGLPWWGMQGHAVYGSGERSIEGPSEESRFLLNPYLLVAADFYGLGVYSPNNFNWDPARVSDAAVDIPDFPLDCYPAALRWHPTEARAEVRYHVSRCIERVRRWALAPDGPPLVSFDLIAYNARDLNLNYVYIAYADSLNLSHWSAPEDAYRIPHFLHRGGSCGYPGGCNNMSPPSPEIDGIQIDGLPAEAVVRLWRSRPRSPQSAPDMLFVIYFD